MTAELFCQAARPPAFMLVTMLSWFCSFVVGIIFQPVQSAIGAYIFIIFMFACIAITVFLHFVMPETKGKTFQEISNMFTAR